MKHFLIATTALTLGVLPAGADTLKLGLATAQTGGLAPYDAMTRRWSKASALRWTSSMPPAGLAATS